MKNLQLLIQALKEVTSDKAIREIMVARTVIDHLSAILKKKDYDFFHTSDPDDIKLNSIDHLYIGDDSLPKNIHLSPSGKRFIAKASWKKKQWYLGSYLTLLRAKNAILKFKETHK